MFCTVFFHGYSLIDKCLSDKCRPLHGKTKLDVKKNLLIRLLACLPIVGQIMGCYVILDSIPVVRGSLWEKRVLGASLIIRGILTVLGLGILCLFIDIIITVATLIKHKNQHAITKLN